MVPIPTPSQHPRGMSKLELSGYGSQANQLSDLDAFLSCFFSIGHFADPGEENLGCAIFLDGGGFHMGVDSSVDEAL
jgi:hypothetical protein